MIAQLGLLVSRTIGRFIPDPFILALGLTVLTAVLALLFGFDGLSRPEAAERLLTGWWGDGLWAFLKFAMQMALILVTGFALAESRPVRALIELIAQLPRDTASAAALVGFVAMVTGLLNWGLGLIVGALMALAVARSLERRSIRVHYPLICAAGYTGLLVWHGGLSGSAPLKMSKESEAADILPESVLANLDINAIPLQETLFSGLNLFVSLGLVGLITIVLFLLAPKADSQIKTASELGVTKSKTEEADDQSEDKAGPFAIALNIIIAIALLGGMVYYVIFGAGRKGAIGPNEINATMLGLGMLLHVSPLSYARAIEKAARGCGGIILQFPLYAGIMAIMTISGLMAMLSNFAAENSTPDTLPILTLISAGIVNFLVPSGGGQWGVQGPIALQAGAAAGVEPSKMIMAVAYGDELTNMLQPFWALPLLAITGIKARDIVGYTAIVMIAAGLWMALGLWMF